MAQSFATLYEYAKHVVDHKTVLQRVYHSPALHSARSATSSWGSFGTKVGHLAGAGIRVAASLIPVPAVPAIASLVEKFAESWGTRAHHEKGANTKDIEQKVKFELKELSVEEMDRYRWKVHQAITDLNTATQGHDHNLQQASQEGHQCTAFVEWMTAAMQAERRVKKLVRKCDIVIGLMQMTRQWAKQCSVGIHGKEGMVGAVQQINNQLRAEIEACKVKTQEEKRAYIQDHHAHCTGWCWAKDLDAPPGAAPSPDGWWAKTQKALAEPFSEFLEELAKEELADHREDWGIKL